jgi:D-3-phosphoglycerate dehydrogenase / 2-oxoglutarate reductase
MTRVLVTCAQMKESLPELQQEIDELGWQIEAPELVGQQFTEDELIDLLPGIEGVIAGDDPFSANVLRSAPHLKAISKWGVGVDAIDVTAAQARGIAVSRTPDMFGDEVADVAIGYAICLARGLIGIHNSVASGGWLKPNGFTLRGKTTVVVGLGSIGTAVAVRLLALGMNVRAVDPSPQAIEQARNLGIELETLDDAAQDANLLVTACPLTAETYGVVNAKVIARMGDPAWLVHVSRGPVVNMDDVRRSLDSGRLAGAALDVYPEEPLPISDPLRGHPNVIFGSHNGSHTREATLRASRAALINLATSLGDS